VYELLQNAQDALKRRSLSEPDHAFPKSVYFSLFPDRLELRHYGQNFNEDDVKGISDILRGTKTLDKKQIGKFGIGFKSVYAFTESPEIHSGDEHFVIERYIRPDQSHLSG
jgi:HSP90 family molecular chaperone